MLVKEWPDPDKFNNRGKFYDSYLKQRAEIEVAKQLLSELSEESIKARIKNLRQQLEGKKNGYAL